MKLSAVKIIAVFSVLFSLAFTGARWESHLLKINNNGSITYFPDEKGNIIPDFSRVGYHQGDKEIPDLKVVKIIAPAGSGSSESIIQQAIDEVASKKADENGYRGAILLRKGRYEIPGVIRINKGGIVLRGEEGTVLIATGKVKRNLVVVSGQGSLKEIRGTRQQITDNYVPVGAKSFKVRSVNGFKVGDNIVVFRPGTQKWISDLKMDQIKERPGTKQWKPEGYNFNFERKITKIDNNTVFIDNPIVMAMEAQYGGGEIYKCSFDGRISEVGVENIVFESEFANDTDEDHGWIALQMDKAENCWARNLTSRYFGYSCVSLERDSKNITVIDCKCLDAKSQITGGRRYSFNNIGQMNLFMNLLATEGRHDYVTGAQVRGPNVFYNCKASQTHSDIGPHHRWAMGTLYDNIVTDGQMNIQDRGNSGSGHGWAGVNQIFWNCKAKTAVVQSPWVSGKNYAIGMIAEKRKGSFEDRPDGVWEGLNQEGLQPESLYMAQLKARHTSK